VRRVHQILSGAGPYDAVSVQARLWRELLRARGFGGGDHAAVVDPRAREHFEPLERLNPGDGDLLVIRYSAYSARLLPLLDLPQRKLLVYHNVTPPGYFWNHHPGVAVACAVGRAQLPLFTRGVDVCVADSAFNAAEMRDFAVADVRVVPILFQPERLTPRGRVPAGAGPLVLVVGRQAPNKRHDLAIAAFAAWRREHAPEARLLCVGEPVSPVYGARVRQVAEALGDGAVTLAGGLSQPDLNSAYAAADAVLSLSEHEGFSVPLLEAFDFAVPVVARPAGAMPEVGADAVLWDKADDLAQTAELLELAVTDSGLREELTRRGRARLEVYVYEKTAAAVTEAIERALA
jgi:glycosyltransferase involved in cell wall biosynthesis